MEPVFRSTPTSFFATLYNLNYDIQENAKKLFSFMNFDGIFGRNDIMEITDVSITAAGNLLNILKNAGLIEAVSGHGNGKYKFIETKQPN